MGIELASVAFSGSRWRSEPAGGDADARLDAERSPGYCQLRVFEGADPLTGKKRYRTQYFRGGKRAAQRQLACS